MKYDAIFRSLLLTATGLGENFVLRAAQNNGLASPPPEANWLSFSLRTLKDDPHIYSADTNFKLNYQLEYLVSIYGPDCIQVLQKIREFFAYNKGADFMHTNGLGFVRMHSLGTIFEYINNQVYQRVDCFLVCNLQENRANPGYLDKADISLHMN